MGSRIDSFQRDVSLTRTPCASRRVSHQTKKCHSSVSAACWRQQVELVCVAVTRWREKEEEEEAEEQRDGWQVN